MISVRSIFLILLCACWPGLATAGFAIVDLPPCERLASENPAPLEIGIVQPSVDTESLGYLLWLARTRQDVAVCAESWQEVLPLWRPAAPQIEKGVGWVAYLAAFLLVLAVAHYCLPRSRWARLTLFGILAFGGMVWLLAAGALTLFSILGGQNWVYHTVLSVRTLPTAGEVERPLTWYEVRGPRDMQNLLATLGYPLPATRAAPVANTPVPVLALPAPLPAGTYLTSQRVNFRTAPSTAAVRLTVLPRLAQVTFAGKTDGDWWLVQLANGESGWVSSLWLRRTEELRLSPGKG